MQPVEQDITLVDGEILFLFIWRSPFAGFSESFQAKKLPLMKGNLNNVGSYVYPTEYFLSLATEVEGVTGSRKKIAFSCQIGT